MSNPKSDLPYASVTIDSVTYKDIEGMPNKFTATLKATVVLNSPPEQAVGAPKAGVVPNDGGSPTMTDMTADEPAGPNKWMIDFPGPFDSGKDYAFVVQQDYTIKHDLSKSDTKGYTAQ